MNWAAYAGDRGGMILHNERHNGVYDDDDSNLYSNCLRGKFTVEQDEGSPNKARLVGRGRDDSRRPTTYPEFHKCVPLL
jgi:hypothetical protein